MREPLPGAADKDAEVINVEPGPRLALAVAGQGLGEEVQLVGRHCGRQSLHECGDGEVGDLLVAELTKEGDGAGELLFAGIVADQLFNSTAFRGAGELRDQLLTIGGIQTNQLFDHLPLQGLLEGGALAIGLFDRLRGLKGVAQRGESFGGLEILISAGNFQQSERARSGGKAQSRAGLLVKDAEGKSLPRSEFGFGRSGVGGRLRRGNLGARGRPQQNGAHNERCAREADAGHGESPRKCGFHFMPQSMRCAAKRDIPHSPVPCFSRDEMSAPAGKFGAPRLAQDESQGHHLGQRSTARATALPPPRQRAAMPLCTSRRIIS